LFVGKVGRKIGNSRLGEITLPGEMKKVVGFGSARYAPTRYLTREGQGEKKSPPGEIEEG